jgi:hypothetical protein
MFMSVITLLEPVCDIGRPRCPALPGKGLRRAGAVLPLLAMAVGLLLPPLAELAERITPLLLGATALLAVLALPNGGLWNGGEPVSLWRAVGAPLLMVMAMGLASPMIGWVAAGALGATTEESRWVALAAAAPAGTGAIGLAVALGLSGGRTVKAVLATTAAAPILLPAVALLTGAGDALTVAELAERLWLLTALPALLALPLRHYQPLARPSSRAGCAAAVVLVLSLTAMARMRGLGPVLLNDPGGLLALLGLACLPSLAGIVIALIVLRGRDPAEAVLMGSYRNITLVWAASGAVLPPEGNLFMALTALPVFMTPTLAALLQRVGKHRNNRPF